ncbi:cupin domain protein [Pseudoramibacter alactolyticus ATCC 23263]|jgi:4-carboxymuconolactone decarboxylase|uniref:Cupin domain protein n=1 Tax=Pseudoramibacter alactolyticus ATCC 23263 TaxID=887929 RepID=E6MK47_9FIRM|nr:carboxymuconolactone decarboxylase family protein [Pseudoramibacter alactolyticus]EFV00566.1 cupin domain protein [Pseudoramibacter alactolyticus ATCC 23263]MBM6968138.1 carboxymuconolactone decarboxylase family protein [Pseudoramibacter alactolyticus]
MKEQRAGRDNLGAIAPFFGELNDLTLFGKVWAREDKLSARDRSMITIAALFAAGLYPQLRAHLQLGKEHGITREEAVEAVTQLAFYCGWPKAWSTFPMIAEVWPEEEEATGDAVRDAYQKTIMFPIGAPNDAYAKYFVGQSYLAPVSGKQFPIANVTFEPGCRNNWHIHHADKGGGQMLICIGGRGWYQEEGKDAVVLTPGTVIEIPPNIKHWHGAASDSWMSHLAFEIPGDNPSNEWLEPVSDEAYNRLK